MKSGAIVKLMIAGWVGLLLTVAGNCRAGSFFPQASRVHLEGRLNCPYLSTSGGSVFLQLAVRTSDLPRPSRRPMNLAVVLDRSGSMGAEGKLENAKAALRTLVDQLQADDILSIVMYDDVVEVLRGACRVGRKDEIYRLIDEVYPRGWTNLGGGMMEGFHQVERNLDRERANRVILLSDGLANRGLTDPAELTGIAKRYRGRSVSLSTIGVGYDYNENLMVSLSERGGGNYYFIESPRNLASVFRKEFSTLSALVAQNASIELTLADGVRVRDVIGCDHSSGAGRHTIVVGDLYAGERREFTVELDIPPGHGKRTVAGGVVRYATEGEGGVLSNNISVFVQHTAMTAEVEKNRDWETQAKAEVAVSTRKVEDALKALDEGKKEEALSTLETVQRSIAASPAAAQGGTAGDMLRAQEAKLKGYSQTLKDNGEDVARAKKSIQYENYKLQKSR